jgi:hypothetical protein
MRKEVFGERLDEDAVIIPDEMETRIFRDYDLAEFDSLTM